MREGERAKQTLAHKGKKGREREMREREREERERGRERGS